MDRLEKKRRCAAHRQKRVAYAIQPKEPRPRLVFVRSNRYFTAQIIDDQVKQTLCSASTNEKSFGSKSTKNKQAAQQLGELLAQRAKEKGLSKVVLDRRGRLYHGCIVEFSETARKQGLVF